MPIFKADGRLIYYAHVPGCAGAAMGPYLAARFGTAAFDDRRHAARADSAQWSRTSPQNIDRGSLARLFPVGFLDTSFAVVRHPVERLASVYRFHREVEGTIPRDTGFSEWLDDLVDLREEAPFAFDNHVRPMDDMVPADAQVFHVEAGLSPVIAWLDTLCGASSDIEMSEGAEAAAPGPDIAVTDYDRDLITRLYSGDFARFGYAPDSGAWAAQAARAPLRRRWMRSGSRR